MSWSLRWERKCASWVICAQTWVGHLDEKRKCASWVICAQTWVGHLDEKESVLHE